MQRRQRVPATAIIAVLAAAFAPMPAPAQTTPAQIRAGDLVRINGRTSERRGGEREGVVSQVGTDFLALETSGGIEAIPLEEIRSVEVGRTRTSGEGFMHGFTRGALFLGIAGATIGLAVGLDCGDDWLCPGPAGGAAILGGMGAAGGGLVFGLLKAADPGVEWQEVPVELVVEPNVAGGAGIGVRVAF